MEKMEILNKEKYAFILAFTASIWKRIWHTMILYCEHQCCTISTVSLLKSLKYNLLSPTGIVSELEPFLEKALTDGFLMPKYYKSNSYVERAIRLYGDTYKISSIEDSIKRKEEEIKFIKDYVSSVFTEDETKKDKERDDIIKNFENFKMENGKHVCEFCDLIDIWDIDVSLLQIKYPIHNIIATSLIKCLTEN